MRFVRESIRTPPPLRTLQQDYAQGPVEVLGGGRFLMSEVHLYKSWSHLPGMHASGMHDVAAIEIPGEMRPRQREGRACLQRVPHTFRESRD